MYDKRYDALYLITSLCQSQCRCFGAMSNTKCHFIKYVTPAEWSKLSTFMDNCVVVEVMRLMRVKILMM